MHSNKLTIYVFFLVKQTIYFIQNISILICKICFTDNSDYKYAAKWVKHATNS